MKRCLELPPEEQEIKHQPPPKKQKTIESDFNEILKSDPNKALRFAINHESRHLISLAKNSGADINQLDAAGRSYLHTAVFHQNENAVRILCEAGVDPNIQDKSKNSALCDAFLKKNINIIKNLIDNDATIHINEPEVAEEFGKTMTPQAMSLFSAHTKNKKSYPFNVTILEEKEIEEYLHTLKEKPLPINEKITICSHGGIFPHWWSAQIRGQDNSELKLFIIDSIRPIASKWTGYGADLSYNVGNILGRNFFKYSVYIDIDTNVRQKDWNSCSMFALSDIKDLCKMDAYLPEYDGDIFKYLEKNKRTEEFLNHRGDISTNIIFTKLPLCMMRASQDKDLVDKIIPSYPKEEQNLLINKKRQTVLEASLTYIKKEKSDKPKVGQETSKTEKSHFYNSRMDRKFEKVVAQTIEYIKRTPLDVIKKEIEAFRFTRSQ